MKNVFNQALFTHRTANTEGFNNLCTIIHKLREEGAYFGEVQRGKYVIGSFNLRFERKLPTHEIHIDAAQFDPLFSKEADPIPLKTFEVGGEGYVVFCTGGHHTELRIKLYRRDEKKAELDYDTAKLNTGDFAVFRLWEPGAYRVLHATDKHAMTLTVRAADGGKYPTSLGRFSPTNVKLTAGGFEPAETVQWPLQALIVQTEIPGALRVELLGGKPVKEKGASAARKKKKDESK